MAGRRRRRTGSGRFLTGLLMTGALVGGTWWTLWRDDGAGAPEIPLAPGPATELTTDRPDVVPDVAPRAEVPEKGAGSLTGTNGRADAAVEQASSRRQRVESLIAAGDQALGRDDLVAARTHFSEAMLLGIDEPRLTRVRAALTRIGNDSIFSPLVYENDPLLERYIVQPGDVLAKIAHTHNVTADLLAKINGIADKNLIRAGQNLKIVHGPFRAVIDRSSFSLDVFLGDTFVAHYRVGLGADGSTPTGQWRVKNKLANPTYYPPRSGRIIAADDPDNPLGERWIGLEGIAGEAVGQERYGIHGTIEPESIGQNSSLGCIRLFNEDVEALYTYLVPKHSTVAIR